MNSLCIKLPHLVVPEHDKLDYLKKNPISPFPGVHCRTLQKETPQDPSLNDLSVLKPLTPSQPLLMDFLDTGKMRDFRMVRSQGYLLPCVANVKHYGNLQSRSLIMVSPIAVGPIPVLISLRI